VEKYGRVRQATDDNIIWHINFAYKITKATNTHSEYVMLIAFPWKNWLCVNVTCICTLPVLVVNFHY